MNLLLEKGCTVRGLADEIGAAPTTVRKHLERLNRTTPQANPEPPKPTVLQASVATARPLTGSPDGNVNPPSIKPVSVDGDTQISTTREASFAAPKQVKIHRSIQFPPRPIPKPPLEQEEDISSMRTRLKEIIITFIKAQCELGKDPSDAARISAILGTAKSYIFAIRPGFRTVQLPQRITAQQLFEETRPRSSQPLREDDHYFGRWVSAIVNSLEPRDESCRSAAIDKAEQELLPAQEG